MARTWLPPRIAAAWTSARAAITCSGLATVAVQHPSGWSLRVRGDGLGESRENGTPLQTNSTGVRQGRFDLAGPRGRRTARRLRTARRPGVPAGVFVHRRLTRDRDADRPAARAGLAVRLRPDVASAVRRDRSARRSRDAGGVATNEETAYLPNGRRPLGHQHARISAQHRHLRPGPRVRSARRTTLVAGAREDIWQRQRGSARRARACVSPRVSVSHRLADRITIRGAFTSSFRPPDVERAVPRLPGREHA